jgi:uncharacterized protein YbjT (DUF2867 family)
MKVFVAGGTGAIGGHAVPALVEAGYAVTALARTAEKAAALSRRGAEPVAVSLFDRSGLAAAFAGHDAVVNLASARRTLREIGGPRPHREIPVRFPPGASAR